MARSQALLNVLNLAKSEELPIEKQFLNDLKASIEIQNEKNARKPSQTYKPSSLHCIRNMFYQRSGAEPQCERSSSELVGICESGTDRHERLQEAVSCMHLNGIDCTYENVAEYVKTHEVPYLDVVEQCGMETKLFNKVFNLSFLCDGIIRYKGKYYILEIKTETNNKFWDRQDVNPDHILQGTAYSLCFGIDDVIFLYECRNTCDKKTFMLHVTDEMKEKLSNKLLDCEKYVLSNEVPPKPDDVSKHTCVYCNYAERCKIDGN